jgi:hypothetical protein
MSYSSRNRRGEDGVLVFQSVLRTQDHGTNPHDVATVYLHLAIATRDGATLDVDDLEHGLTPAARRPTRSLRSRLILT